ncbi:hypothetical protein I4U23_015745 [Adineta vaga]|nr:hypothetical protein I4U23_015745 [Adineta vaga]
MESTIVSSTQLTRKILICRICGDVARGMNFDVITCMSCKNFFRRNALRPVGTLRCLRRFNCEINKEKRTQCAACRLKKCLTFGMKRQLIQAFHQPRSLDLLQNDRSTLTSDQWTLISNIMNLHDTEILMIQQQALLTQDSTLPIRRRAKPSLTLDFFHNCLQWVQSLLKRSNHYQSLSIDAQQILLEHNVHHNDSLVKLFLFVMLFSSNCSPLTLNSSYYSESVSNSLELLHIQDIFVTILWKYLVYQYGSIEATIRYVLLVKTIVDLISVKEQMSSVPIYEEMMNETMLEIKHSLIIHN